MPTIKQIEGRRIQNRNQTTLFSSSKRRTTLTSSYCLLIFVFLMAVFSMFQRKPVSGMASKALANGGSTAIVAKSVSNVPNGSPSSQTVQESRLRAALWGFFAGDAVASPTHWYYGGKRQIVQDYGSEITDYTKPKYQLAGSIMNKSDLNGGGRSKSFAGSSRSSGKTIIGDVINHGKQDLWSPTKSIHYHATLQKGENTLEASIARVLMRSIVQNEGRFNADDFRKSYLDFMMKPGSHNDTYASTCHRMFFYNLFVAGLPPKDCPDNDEHNVDTIDGLVLPTIVALAGIRNDVSQTEMRRVAAECASVTRRSSLLEKIASEWANVVVSAVKDVDDEAFQQSLNDFARQNIRRLPNAQVNDDSTMSACYLSSSLPGLVDMTAKYLPTSRNNGSERVWQGLLANANVGGENVHRGSVMGAVLGARASELPTNLMEGLYSHAELAKEIDDFVHAVLPAERQSEEAAAQQQ